MRLGWLGLGAVSLLMAVPAMSQVSVYGEVSASRLHNLAGSNVVVGPTIGITAGLLTFHHLVVSGDVRASFLGDSIKYDGVAVGPKVSLPIKRYSPYVEAAFGFARYNDGQGTSSSATTDGQTQINTGLDFRLTDRFDYRIFEFGYSQFYGLGGQFNPKTFSTGVVFYLGKR